MNFDIEQVPFSIKGSYIAVSRFKADFCNLGNPEGVFLRSIHGLTYIPNSTMLNRPPFCARIVPAAGGHELSYALYADEAEVRMVTEHGEVHMCFADEDTLLLGGSGSGVDLELIDGNYAYTVGACGQRHIMMNCGPNGRRFLIRCEEGAVTLVRQRAEPCCRTIRFRADEGGTFLAAIEDVAEEWKPAARTFCYEESRAARRRDFDNFLETVPMTPPEYEEARRLAAYVNWSCIVKKAGLLKRDGMLMAKNWMCNIWSWDHCFNALALSRRNPALAWDQFMLPFDFQGESGRIPDCVSDTYAIWTFCKPPVHGWTLSKMMKVMELTVPQLSEAYEKLSKWTDWWLIWRDGDGDGICEYHHGCDSGWDNSTAFRKHPVMETPDLAAFLILQMETLHQLALKLGLPDESAGWKDKADHMLEAMLRHCFDGVRPRALVSGTHEEVACDSLLLYLPLLLGEKLPAGIRKSMVAALKDKFLTPYGLATEAIESIYYEPDGYWRGPVWAPSTLLLVEGLDRCGEHALAAEIAKRYCNMAADSGFAENFDALTGEGLRDKAYTWTSSVFLILAEEYLITLADE
ncbi:MAG: glycogen debranching protein [Oscillibacter sp.]|nr:glycogen debranching protein [Oscillibacter sp.]